MHTSKFYQCPRCGNIVIKAHDGGGALQCCGGDMVEMVANTTDAAQEKHVPAITRDGDKVSVQVGSVAHPMADDHFIEFIYLVSGTYTASRHLHPGDEPKAEFVVPAGDPVTVYEFCNKHGLWSAEA